jgi:hypothetical protein
VVCVCPLSVLTPDAIRQIEVTHNQHQHTATEREGVEGVVGRMDKEDDKRVSMSDHAYDKLNGGWLVLDLSNSERVACFSIG